MAREKEFKAWLKQGGEQTAKRRNSRAFAVRIIEQNLNELEMPFQDLDEAWEADRFKLLCEWLSRMQKDADDGGQDYRILIPASEKPDGWFSGWGNFLKQYGQFLDSQPPG